MEKYIVTRHFRCTKQEDEQITKRAANENKSTSAYLRDAALNRAVPIFDERIAKILRDILENELRIGTNINQAVRLCNSKSAISRRDYEKLTDYLMQLMTLRRELITKLAEIAKPELT